MGAGVRGGVGTSSSMPETSGKPLTRSFRKSKRLSDSIHCFLEIWKKRELWKTQYYITNNPRSKEDRKRNCIHSHVRRTQRFGIFCTGYLHRFGKQRMYEQLQSSRWANSQGANIRLETTTTINNQIHTNKSKYVLTIRTTKYVHPIVLCISSFKKKGYRLWLEQLERLCQLPRRFAWFSWYVPRTSYLG